MGHMGHDTNPATGEVPLPALDNIAAVATTLISHPVYAADHVWNAGVRATIDHLHQEMTEAATR